MSGGRPLITYTMAFNFIAALSLLAVILCASGTARRLVPLMHADGWRHADLACAMLLLSDMLILSHLEACTQLDASALMLARMLLMKRDDAAERRAHRSGHPHPAHPACAEHLASLSLPPPTPRPPGSQSIVPLLKTPVCNAPPPPSDDASSAPFPLVNGSSVSPAANTFASDTPAPVDCPQSPLQVLSELFGADDMRCVARAWAIWTSSARWVTSPCLICLVALGSTLFWD